MGSVFTCKLNPCCGDRRNCDPPRQYYSESSASPPKPQTEGVVEALREALMPFARVADAYDYFIPDVMPDLQFPVAGTITAADPGFERSLSEDDFRRAKAALAASNSGSGR